MKKLLLSLLLILSLGTIKAQNLYNYGFSGVTADLDTAGWIRTNQSQLASATSLWSISSYVSAASVTGITSHYSDTNIPVGTNIPVPNGQAGGANSFCKVNFTSTTDLSGTGSTISNWLISPSINVMNGDIVTFYTRSIRASSGVSAFGDSLQLRMSTNGDFSTDPTLGFNDLGDYNILAVNVNPTIGAATYPTSWTQFTYTVTGLSGATDCKFAFRYYVTNAGFNAPKGDDIGIDTFTVDRPLATNSFFASNYTVGPNPANDVVNVSAKNNNTINTVEITDVNGRVVKNVTVNATTSQINLADLNSGVYFIKASSENGVGTSKIVKK